jgi:hypothetical protein
MASTDLAVSHTFDELARLVDRVESVEVRIRRVDGTAIEGVIHNVDYVNVLFVEQRSGDCVEVRADEIETLDVNVPRRGREWTVAIVGIVVTTTALVAYAQLPWVPARPREGDIFAGFIALAAIGAGLGSIRPLRDWFTSWFTRWQRFYPPVAQASGVRRVQPGHD